MNVCLVIIVNFYCSFNIQLYANRLETQNLKYLDVGRLHIKPNLIYIHDLDYHVKLNIDRFINGIDWGIE